MRTTRKIQAFTISEMVVVLILTSIVVGLAFSVLTLVQKHMVGIQTNFIKNTELNKLEQSLSIDFNRYSKITYDDRKDILTFKTALDSITYQFKKEMIIKDTDTFNIQMKTKTLYFDGNKVNNGTIDAIKLETTKAFQSQHLFIFKKNDATPFMN